MHKVIAVIASTTLCFASYNPFFTEPAKKTPPKTAPQTQTVQKIVTVTPPPKQLRYDVTYYGFIEAQSKSYALLKLNSKSFAISEGDSFYVDNQKVDVVKINSNRVVVKNMQNYQTFYFSKGQ
jgi:hypothetical protein